VLSSRFSSDRLKIILAFVIVYIVWGSTYVATKITLESLPPFLMTAIRFLIAGAIMYGWASLRGAPRPERAHLLPTALLGILLLVFGSTGVALAVRSVPTGLVSLLVAIVPVYIVLLQWLRPGGIAPTKPVVAGIFVGMTGLIVLLGPDKFASNHGIDLFGVMCVMIGSLGSAIGALYARSARLPASGPQTAGMEMLFAGAVLIVISAIAGEFSFFQHFSLSLKSALSLLYLIVIGSMLAFSAYNWLLVKVPTTRVSTYAYVNPVVAVFLGWFLVGEGITTQTIVGAAIILSAVALITRSSGGGKLVPVRAEAESDEMANTTRVASRDKWIDTGTDTCAVSCNVSYNSAGKD
jgi:drug/metabolite transporter (DMT)-like permease